MDKVFISGDAFPSETIIKGDELEQNNCIRQDLCPKGVLQPTLHRPEDEVEEDIYP